MADVRGRYLPAVPLAVMAAARRIVTDRTELGVSSDDGLRALARQAGITLDAIRSALQAEDGE